MVTTREIAIARSVIYASLFDYPLTLEELHYSLIGSDQTRAEILAGDEGSELLRDLVEYRDGFFFPMGRDRGQATLPRGAQPRVSRAAPARAAADLRAPFHTAVALSGSIAHRNLEPNGDLDLFIVTQGPRVWTVTVMLLVLTKLLRRRWTICANFVCRFASHRRPAGPLHRKPGDPSEAAHRRRSAGAVQGSQSVRRPLLPQ